MAKRPPDLRQTIARIALLSLTVRKRSLHPVERKNLAIAIANVIGDGSNAALILAALEEDERSLAVKLDIPPWS